MGKGSDDEMETEERKEKEEDADEAGSSVDESSDEEMPQVELLVLSRERRANAGAKMQKLLESAGVAAQEDEFYKTAYEGGFTQEDDDDDFHSVASDGDVVDSDFDLPEEEDEPVSDADAQEGENRKRREPSRRQEERRRRAMLAKNKWVYARLGGKTVKANVVDEQTQKKRLEEAKETERLNLESLAKYEQLELEKKKKRNEKTLSARKVVGPRIHSMDGPKGKIVIYPESMVIEKGVTRSLPRQRVCVVTGKPARYTEPITGLPYYNMFAYKVIIDQYRKFLHTEKKNLPEVREYFSHFET